MNSCSFVGRLVRDPELFAANGTDVVKFTLAINEYRRSKTGQKTKQVDYLDFEAWDSGATTISKYCSKGDELAVSASARQDRWNDPEGNKRSKIKFRVNSFNLFSQERYSEPKETEATV